MSADAHRQAGGGRTLDPDETFINAEFAQLSGYSVLEAPVLETQKLATQRLATQARRPGGRRKTARGTSGAG
jgi:hypothetical protein